MHNKKYRIEFKKSCTEDLSLFIDVSSRAAPGDGKWPPRLCLLTLYVRYQEIILQKTQTDRDRLTPIFILMLKQIIAFVPVINPVNYQTARSFIMRNGKCAAHWSFWINKARQVDSVPDVRPGARGGRGSPCSSLFNMQLTQRRRSIWIKRGSEEKSTFTLTYWFVGINLFGWKNKMAAAVAILALKYHVVILVNDNWW